MSQNATFGFQDSAYRERFATASEILERTQVSLKEEAFLSTADQGYFDSRLISKSFLPGFTSYSRDDCSLYFSGINSC